MTLIPTATNEHYLNSMASFRDAVGPEQELQPFIPTAQNSGPMQMVTGGECFTLEIDGKPATAADMKPNTVCKVVIL